MPGVCTAGPGMSTSSGVTAPAFEGDAGSIENFGSTAAEDGAASAASSKPVHTSETFILSSCSQSCLRSDSACARSGKGVSDTSSASSTSRALALSPDFAYPAAR